MNTIENGFLLCLTRRGMLVVRNAKTHKYIASFQLPPPQTSNETLYRSIIERPYKLVAVSANQQIVAVAERCAPRILLMNLPTKVRTMDNFPNRLHED